jgi:hypothetical protein
MQSVPGQICTCVKVFEPQGDLCNAFKTHHLLVGRFLRVECIPRRIHAQTAWPAYMASLASALSESTVTAVLLPDVKITVPDAGLSKDKARWSGLWAGWACRGWQCDVRLAVEQVSESGATMVYAGATAGQAQITERAQALFDGDELHVRLRTGAKLALRMRLDGDVELSLWKPDDKLVSAGVLTQKKLPYTRTVERVPTPWTEGGQPLTLEMVTYSHSVLWAISNGHPQPWLHRQWRQARVVYLHLDESGSGTLLFGQRVASHVPAAAGPGQIGRSLR